MQKPCATLLCLLTGVQPVLALAQSAEPARRFEEAYDDTLLNLHQRGNYAYDLEWQLDWERQLLSGNGVRINVGSVTSNDLGTDAEVNLNVPLNASWRFQGQFRRDQNLEVSDEDEFLVGLERLFGSSALFAQVDPRFDKETIDVFAGYTHYADKERTRYTRIGLLLEDVAYDDRNEAGGTTEEAPVAVRWAVRRGTDSWWIYTDGTVGTGYRRSFDGTLTNGILEEERRDNRARIRLSHQGNTDALWSVWFDWSEFSESRRFASPELDDDYRWESYSLAFEHIRIIGDVHRLRFLFHMLFQRGDASGPNAHRYRRYEPIGGFFYERLWQRNSLMAAAVMSTPDATYEGEGEATQDLPGSFADKLILGWRHRFSPASQLLISVSHKVTGSGFGGGNVQFQMFF